MIRFTKDGKVDRDSIILQRDIYALADALDIAVAERDALAKDAARWRQWSQIAAWRDTEEWVQKLLTDAEMYRFLRDCPTQPPDEEMALLWEELITTECTGSKFDATVRRMRERQRELDAAQPKEVSQ